MRRLSMALLEGLTESLGGSLVSNLLLGIGVVPLAPVVAPALLAGLRPLAKTMVKGGVLFYDTAWEMVAEAGEQMSDIVAEARAELAAPAAASAATAEQSTQQC
jgi:hypothetical protein